MGVGVRGIGVVGAGVVDVYCCCYSRYIVMVVAGHDMVIIVI